MLTHLEPNQILNSCAYIGNIVRCSATWVSQWTLQFIHNKGAFCNVGYSPRGRSSLVYDPVNKKKMTVWMDSIISDGICPNADNFAKFFKAEFGVEIGDRTAQTWLKVCGFKFKNRTNQEIYHDGHQREDAQLALKQYIEKMNTLKDRCITYTGESMHYIQLICRSCSASRRSLT